MTARKCINGCNFYGSIEMDGMCSICYKQAVSKMVQRTAEIVQEAESLQSSSPDKPLEGEVKRRCFVCSKKLSLAMQIKCKCNQMFCSIHKYPDNHRCAFDYATHNKEILAKRGIKVVAEKIQKI
jgi:hypothetical protein